MNCFHHYAVVVFVIACNVVHGIQIKHKYDEYILSNDVISDVSESSKIELLKFDDLYNILRRKRGFFSSFKIPMPNMEFVHEDDDKNGVENTTVTSDADLSTTVKPGITATVNEAYNSFLDMMQSSKEIQIVAIGSDVKKSLVEAAPYLPLVNKLTKYIMPDLSMRDVVTLSLNVALLTTLGASDNANAQVNGDQSQSDIRNMVGQYATDIYGKLKDAFKSHIGQITNYFSNEEKTDSLAETHSIFDQMKKKMNSFMNSVDEPQTENKENQIETTLTQTYIENSQIPLTKTIVTKTYESDVEPIRRAINDEKYVIPKNKLLKNRNYKVNEIITEMKNELISEENWKNDSDMESYDYDNGDENMDDVDDDDGADDDDVDDADDDDDYDDDNITIDDNVEIKEEDFNKVMQESMVLQADFVNTLDGKELLKHIEDLLKSLPNLNTNHKNRKTFKAVTEELGIDEQYSGDRVNKLINVLEVITNYFIVKAIEANVLLK